ncbi:hypothetical protein ACQ4PT_053081 [Festuca glaucescens]
MAQSCLFLFYEILTLRGSQICYRQGTPTVLIFFTHSGYSREEILGCNCRFLSGPDTSVDVLEEISRHICCEEACTVRLLNYRKDGSTFRDLLQVSPIRNASGKVAFHVWVSP